MILWEKLFFRVVQFGCQFLDFLPPGVTYFQLVLQEANRYCRLGFNKLGSKDMKIRALVGAALQPLGLYDTLVHQSLHAAVEVAQAQPRLTDQLALADLRILLK
jgi:hypothetical protein